MLVNVTWLNEDADEIKLEVSGKFEVCPHCQGRGISDPDAFSGNVDQMISDDPDFKEQYYAGHYDVACPLCNGQRVIAVVDVDALNNEEKKLYKEHLTNMAELKNMRSENLAEIMNGA